MVISPRVVGRKRVALVVMRFRADEVLEAWIGERVHRAFEPELGELRGLVPARAEAGPPEQALCLSRAKWSSVGGNRGHWPSHGRGAVGRWDPPAGGGFRKNPPVADETMSLYDLRVTVERIEGRSVCGLEVGDYFELTESSKVRIPAGKHFCLYALQAVIPLLPAKQRRLPESDWLERDSLVACPDPDERVIMRIERIGTQTLRTDDLT
jgi:uncharacterized repeat protein (TIGR04076 family)